LDYRQIARQKAQKYGLLPEVFERQIEAESGFNPKAVSSAGALGIAQIMPSTARGWGVDPRNPVAALDAAAKNMAAYIRTYGGFSTKDPSKVRAAYEKALQAYNAGPGSVGKYMPRETVNYIRKIVDPNKFSFTEALKGNPSVVGPTSAAPEVVPTGQPISLPKYDIADKVQGLVSDFITRGFQPPSNNGELKSTQYLALANKLEDTGTEEGLELADAYYAQALNALNESSASSTPDVGALFSQILGEKIKESQYNKQVTALESALSPKEQQKPSFEGMQNLPVGKGFALKGAVITSPVDTTGEPGFDFALPGGRGVPFPTPFTGQVVGIERNQNWETNLEKGPGKRGYGNWVDIRAIDPVTKKPFDVRFAHFDAVNPNLKVGSTIDAGTVIGKQGRTGSTTGPHVSADFYLPGSNKASAQILEIRNRIRDRIAKGLPVF
jgi:murein DD-endopeptidase MepM/ murein hydrolase activator NlpD